MSLCQSDPITHYTRHRLHHYLMAEALQAVLTHFKLYLISFWTDGSSDVTPFTAGSDENLPCPIPNDNHRIVPTYTPTLGHMTRGHIP